MPDSIGKLIFLSKNKIDTLTKDKSLTFTQDFILTSFDSGEYVVPGFPILIIDKEKTDTFITNTIFLKFRTVAVDTSQTFKDIKPIMELPWSIWDYYPFLLAILIAAILIYAYILIRKKLKRQKKEDIDYDPSIPPNLLAIEALRQLESEKLWQKGLVKQYHSQLSEILRTYIERQFKVIALELTTQEIIHELRLGNIYIDTVFTLKKTLELSDMVKFAKYQPIPDEHTTAIKNAFSFVERTSDTKNIAESQSEENNNV
jgi:hypothetical protein